MKILTKLKSTKFIKFITIMKEVKAMYKEHTIGKIIQKFLQDSKSLLMILLIIRIKIIPNIIIQVEIMTLKFINVHNLTIIESIKLVII